VPQCLLELDALVLPSLSKVMLSLSTWAKDVEIDVPPLLFFLPYPASSCSPSPASHPPIPTITNSQAFAAQNARLSMEAHNAKAAASSMR